MSDGSSFNGFAIGFFLGAVAGVAIGFLYAPKPGRETRTMLAEKAGEVREKAADVTEKAREMAVETGKRIRRRTGAGPEAAPEE